MAVKIRWTVDEIDNVLLVYDQMKVYRSVTGATGAYSEITDPGSRVELISGQTSYEYIDTTGAATYWYRVSYFNSTTLIESTYSSPISGADAGGQYCTIQDIRDEGFTDPPHTDSRIVSQIALASAAIDTATGWWFEARAMTLYLDGDGTRTMRVGVPIIAVDSVTMDEDDVDLDDLIVYNRYIAHGQRIPDDRRNPRIEWNLNISNRPGQRVVSLVPMAWTAGQQNVTVTGTFGFTEHDGSPTGKTPEMLSYLCKLLTIRNLELLSDPDARLELVGRGNLTKEKTRNQEKGYAVPKLPLTTTLANGLLTGDPEIDGLIRYFRKPSNMTAI